MERLGRQNWLARPANTLRTKRDAEDWARRTEDGMVRSVYIQRRGSECMAWEMALPRYVSEISLTFSPKKHDDCVSVKGGAAGIALLD